MRPAVLLGLLLAGCAALDAPGSPQAGTAPPASTQVGAGPSQIWRGALRCGPIRGIGTAPSNAPIHLTVTGSVVRYDRTDAINGVDEQGGGTIAADGSLTLSGEASAPAYHYSAQYSGVLRPDGETTRLTGLQKWTSRGTKPRERPCSITLKRES